MRPEPEFALQDMTTVHLTPPQPSGTCDPQLHDCRWWPYSNTSSDNFGADTAMIIVILLCALICSLALHTSIRCFLRTQQQQQQHQQQQEGHNGDDRQPKPENGSSEFSLVVAPAVLYTLEMVIQASECAICLSEFVEGDGVRVLGKCEHVFHVGCIEKWLSSHSSCPICRRSCLATHDSPPHGDVAVGDRCSFANNASDEGSSNRSEEAGEGGLELVVVTAPPVTNSRL